MSLSGTLPCSYHPFEYVNSGVRTILYSSDSAYREPTSCSECKEYHLKPNIRSGAMIQPYRNTVLSQLGRIKGLSPSTIGPGTWRIGCTRIDHCEDVMEVLNHPYLALPVSFADLLAMDVRDHQELNIMMIDKPRQLERVLEIDIPGTKDIFRKSIEDVYEDMAGVFELPPLADSILAAKIHNPESSISRLKPLKHKDADRKDRIRMTSSVRALFVPFIIVTRVSQQGVGSKGMRLRKR